MRKPGPGGVSPGMAAAFGGYRAHTPQGAARPVPPQGAKAAESPRGLAIGGMNYEAYQ